MEMAAVPSCPCSSFIFFPPYNDAHLHNLPYFPFCRFPHPLSCRRFCSYAARDRSSSRRRRGNQLDSNAETVRAKGFSFKFQNEEEEVEDDDEERVSSGILEEAIDSIWILKVFKSYGWLLPPFLLSLLIATGLKAFLMALAVPLGLSVITLVFQKLVGLPQSQQKRRAKVRKKTKNKYGRTVRSVKMEKEASKGQNVGKEMNQNVGKEMKEYQSWVNDGASVNVGSPETSSFGGWDELDGIGSMRMSSTVMNGSKRTIKEKSKLTEKESISDNTPLLVRLLIAVFPFLGSWTKMFW